MSSQRKTSSSSSGGRGASRASAGSSGSKGGKPSKRLGRRILQGVFLSGLFLLVLGAAAFAYAYSATEIPDPNRNFQTQTSFVYYADGKTEIGRFAKQDRQSIPLADVPEHVQEAVIAAEDRSFYTNQGIDPKGILRAAFSNATSESTQGASTITQQYVKVRYLTQERTLSRKAKEALLSLKIHRQMDKPEILEGYLNTIYFGRGSYGIQAAAQAFFDKDASQLNVREGAALAAVLNSPGNLDPDNGPEARQELKERYEYVLQGMAEMEVLPEDRAEEAARRLPEFPKISQGNQYGGQRGHVLALVKQQLRAEGFSEFDIDGGGLRITTTFTRKGLNSASQAVKEQRPPGLRQLHVAVASVQPGTGALRGMYAGQNYLDSQINWAVEGGQPGSSFKAFAVPAAIKDGFSLRDTFDGNSPYVLPDGSEVENQGNQDYGSAISMVTATANSVNTAFIDMTMSMDRGPQKIIDMAVGLGIPRKTPGLNPTAGVSLGSATVSPIDMANAYGGIAEDGQASDWYVIERVEDASGDPLYEAPQTTRRAMSADIAADTSYALQQVVQQGSGTAALALGRPAAGKTGTATNDNGDVSSSWFVGYTPQLSTAVMYVRGDGNDQLEGYMPEFFGGSYPARTWTAFMQGALEGRPVLDFPPPVFVDGVAPDSGHEPTPTEAPAIAPTPEAPPPAPEPTTEAPEPEPTTAEPEPSPPPTRSPDPEPEPPDPEPEPPEPTEPEPTEPEPTEPTPTEPPEPEPTEAERRPSTRPAASDSAEGGGGARGGGERSGDGERSGEGG